MPVFRLLTERLSRGVLVIAVVGKLEFFCFRSPGLCLLCLLLFTLGMESSTFAWSQEEKEEPRVEAGEAKIDESSQGPQTTMSSPLPPFKNVRYQEDWSSLSSSARESNYRRLKFIPLNSDGSAYLSFGGQIRLRGELWRDFGFGGSGIRDDEFGLTRVRFHSDLWLSSQFRIFFEGKSSLATHRQLPGGQRTLDVDSADIQNLLLDINLPSRNSTSTLRFGRQELQFGKQRLVSPLDWSNTRRTWDAARFIFESGGWKLDGFWSEYVRINKYSLNCADDSGIDLYGVYLSRSGPVNFDLYWLGYEREQASWVNAFGKEERQTLGGRLAGGFLGEKVLFDVEGAYQAGSVGTAEISAAMFAGQVGYTLESSGLKPKIYTGFDYGSGDDDSHDSKIGTFNQLFPLGHAYLGLIDIVGRQNIIDWSAGWSMAPANRVRMGLDWHNFWRAHQQDALYNAGGGVVRRGAPGSPRRVGSEIDMTASFALNRHLLLSGGYAHFFAGDFIQETGSAEGINFIYAQIQTTF